MKTLILCWSAALVFTSCQQPRAPYDVKAEEAAVRAVIDGAQIAWNNGDLEGFMQSYWKSDSLQFYSKRGINHGWQEALDGYKKSYPDLSSMGTLHFDILSVTPMGEIGFIVLGKYTVTRVDNTLEGAFTLIFKKKDGRWVAVYDHTC